MFKFILLLVLIVGALSTSHVFAVRPDNLDYFVFLVTGKSAAGTAKEEIEQMQKAHIGNFERLAGLGELSAAGPCSDPEKNVRGIVVVHATSLAGAEAKFGADPYVTQGFMKTEIHPYRSIVGKFVIPEDITKLDEYTIVIVSRGEKWGNGDALKQIHVALQSFAKEHHTAGSLGFAALFDGASNNTSPRVAVMVFRGNGQAKVEQLLSDWKPVREDIVKVNVFPQYLVKDALPSE